MPNPSREEKLALWIAEEQAARARLGEPGTSSLAEVSALLPGEFFERISNGELPCGRGAAVRRG